MTIPRRHSNTTATWLLLLLLVMMMTACTCTASSSFIPRNRNLALFQRSDYFVRIPRGGSSIIDAVDDDDDDEGEQYASVEKGMNDEEEEDEDADADDDDGEEQEAAANVPKVSSEPVNILFKTNMGNALIDTKLELLVSRSRNIESVKQTLSRMLPGRPPVESLRLVSEGIVLEDDQLIDGIVDEDDEDDDEEEEEEERKEHTVVLTLDMVPPVDPKFATHLLSMNEMSTSQILDAYTANAAAMYHNAAQCLVSSSEDEEDPWLSRPQQQQEGMISVKLRQAAHEIRQQLEQSCFSEHSLHVLQESEPPSTEMVDERRGQRYRTSKGGARTNLKRTIQTNLNINWADTVRNFMLFLFFGFFGGRSTVSRNVLLLGAPMCFVVQARPIKILLKQAFYACANPPGIFLSLLPAPQQAILNFNENEAFKTLYDGIVKEKLETTVTTEEAEEEEDVAVVDSDNDTDDDDTDDDDSDDDDE